MTKRQHRGAARERLVVAAAAELIAERGLANIRVADVAERAGMTPGHVTYYFRSKTELLMRAIRQSEAAFTDRLEAELRAIEDPWQRLDRLVELSAATGPGDPGWVLWFEVWSSAALDPEVARVHEELDGRSRQILEEVIEYGRSRGAFRTDDPPAAAVTLAAVIDGLSIQLTLGAPHLTRPELLRLCAETARANLGPRPAVSRGGGRRAPRPRSGAPAGR
jgi:AcrR family transcriptional regulator